MRARSPKPCTDGGSFQREAASQTWSGVLLVVHLEHQAAGPGDELLLVGLHPKRERHQLGQVGPVTAVAGDERLEPSG